MHSIVRPRPCRCQETHGDLEQAGVFCQFRRSWAERLAPAIYGAFGAPRKSALWPVLGGSAGCPANPCRFSQSDGRRPRRSPRTRGFSALGNRQSLPVEGSQNKPPSAIGQRWGLFIIHTLCTNLLIILCVLYTSFIHLTDPVTDHPDRPSPASSSLHHHAYHDPQCLDPPATAFVPTN